MVHPPDSDREPVLSDEDVEAIEDELLSRPQADEADVVEQHLEVPVDEEEDEPRDHPS
ncbi:hypothetical protein [uncultured Phycicoccus sp.]|uniref:hypothetical protein n=1 Tax=uncultured Phycicoccus sp. TaxID=661422 RepID=UPI002613901E|nr:hypothetical protein [uncultured Phycicoccus sp.]